jgi:tetratricopeptide (TPR) repeat protein
VIGGKDRPWRPGDGTRPGSDWWSTWHGGDNRPWRPDGDGDWGWHDHDHHNHWNNDWHNNWYNNHVDNHYNNWYHGSWSDDWSDNWYVPAAVGAAAWGLGAASSAWYGGEYYNPYYSEPVATASPSYYYDYSQPVSVYDYGQQYSQQDYSQQYATTEPQQQVIPQPQAAPPISQSTIPTPPQAEPPTAEPGLAEFDAALAAFKSGDYGLALQQCNEALRLRPQDPVIHEVRALALFAQGDYKPAAATLNALLTTSPGMDWSTLSGLYGNADDYSQQLRQLESQCQSNPRDGAAHFVLAYHYLVTGHAEEAIEALRVVVAQQPRDATAKHMLEALAPADEPAKIAASPTPPEPSGVRQASATEPASPEASAAKNASAPAGPETDLVGRWRAEADGTTIELTIDGASKFQWSATPPGGTATQLSGNLVAARDTLVLDSESQGAMVGNVKTIGADEFHFALAGGPPEA